MSTTSRGTDFKRLPTSLFCLLIVINCAKATIDYAAVRSDTIPQETKRGSLRTTRTLLEELIQRNITSGDYLQHGTEHLLQYGALLRTQILDTFGKLVYDHYDDFSMSQMEALYRVYRETLERKYNIFDIVPSVLNESDTRPTKICAYIYDHVKTCLKESSKVCMNVAIHDEPHRETPSNPALNITRKIYELAEISTNYPRGFSPAAVLEYLRSGRLHFTTALFSGLLHNIQYDSFDDKVRTAERELVLFLTKASRNFFKETKMASTSARSVSELLRNYLTTGNEIFTGKALRHASYLADHVVREVNAISENIEWLGTAYDNSTINLKYLFELILPNDTMDEDIVDARNYLLHQMKDKKIVEKYLRIEKYQQAGPDQLLMEIFGQMRDIHFAEDLVASLYIHARFWHKSHMITNLDELLELFDAYENLRGVSKYQELLQNADRIKSYLVHSKNLSVELLCSRPRTCLRIGLEMVKNCTAIDETTKKAIDVFTNPNRQCSCLKDVSLIRITNDPALEGGIDESNKESSTPEGTGTSESTSTVIDDTTTASLENLVGLTPRPLEKDLFHDEDEKLGTGGNDEEISTSTLLPAPDIFPGLKPDDSPQMTSEPLMVKQTKGKGGNCKIGSNGVDSSGSSSCEENDNEKNSRSRSDCEGPNCPTVTCEGDNCQNDRDENETLPGLCDGRGCEDNMKVNLTVSTGERLCSGQNCPPETCVGNYCQDNAILCDISNCSNASCEGGDCPYDRDNSSSCQGSDCENNSQFDGTSSTAPCEGLNCSSVELLDRCEGSDCSTELGVECDGDRCSREPMDSECQTPDCRNAGISMNSDDTGCQGTNCTYESCKGPDCPIISIVDCKGLNCTDINCIVSNCTKDDRIECEDLDCSNNNCTGPDCLEDTKMNECESSNCFNNVTGDCLGNVAGANSTGRDCPGFVPEAVCLGPDCPSVVSEEKPICEDGNCSSYSCEDGNCDIIFTEKPPTNRSIEDRNGNKCEGKNCNNDAKKLCEESDCPSGLNPASEKLCMTNNCTTVTPTLENNCEGDHCTGNSTRKDPNKIEQEQDCDDNHCKMNSQETCEGNECDNKLSKEKNEQITEETCLGDNCTTVSPTLEVDCEGVNCTSDSTEVKLKNIENEENCKTEDCERNVKKSCEGSDCVDELPEREVKTITKEPCNGENCTSSTLHPEEKIDQARVPTEPSVKLAFIRTPTVTRVTTFCGNRDPHYRRRRNRLRKMRRLDDLTSPPIYQGWNNIISPSVIEKISKKVNKFPNINVHEDSSFDVNKNSNINVNTVKMIVKKFDRMNRNEIPLLQVLGNTRSTPRHSKSKKNDGRRSAQLPQEDDERIKVFEIEESSMNSPNRTGVKMKNMEKNTLVMERIDKKTKRPKIMQEKKMPLKFQLEGLRTIKRTDSEESSLNKSRELQREEYEFEEDTKNNRQEVWNLRSTEKTVREEENRIDEGENNEEIKAEIETESKKVEKSAVKNDTTSIGNDKLSANRRKKILLTKWHKLGVKASWNNVKNATKFTNAQQNDKQEDKVIKPKVKKLEKSTENNNEKSSGYNKLNEKRGKRIFKTRWHNLRIKVNQNQRRLATNSTHEQENNKSVSDDEISDEEELEKEAQTNALESQKKWKTIKQESSIESSVTTTNEEKSKDNKLKNNMKPESDEIHIIFNKNHGWEEIRKNVSTKHGEKDDENEIQDDLENSSVQNTMEEKNEGTKNVNTKTKFKIKNGWDESQRRNSAKSKTLPEETGSQSHGNHTLEGIVSQQEIVMSKSKMTRNSRKKPTQSLKKRKVKTKHRSRGGHTWETKTLETEKLQSHLAEPTVLGRLEEDELLDHVLKFRNGKENILPLNYRLDLRNTKSSVINPKLGSKIKKSIPEQIMKTQQEQEV